MILDFACILVSLATSIISFLLKSDSLNDKVFKILSKRYLDLGESENKSTCNEIVSIINKE